MFLCVKIELISIFTCLNRFLYRYDIDLNEEKTIAMRKKIMILVLLIISSGYMFGQVKFGVRGGVSTMDITPKDIMTTDLKMKIDKVYFGIHGGLFLQAEIGKFFIQPEILFNSNKVDYLISDIKAGLVNTILTERYQYLDMPVMVGLKVSALRFQVGPIGHYFLHSKSDLLNISGYEQKFNSFTFGYQAGIGVDFGKVVLDLKYEGNFSNYGDHIRIDNQAYNFDDKPSRLVLSVGMSIF